MSDNSTISIIIPVYKVEKYIRKCLDSVINQTYKNLQIIIVDDGSPDKCGEICNEYAKRDDRIQVIHKKNGGISDARNVGIRAATGKYIGFVDSDDYISSDMFEDMYNLIESQKADVCITNFYTVNGDNVSIKNIDAEDKILSSIEVLKEILLDKSIQSYAWNKLYKRELFNDIEYPVGKKYEDIGTTFYIMEKCDKIIVSSKPYYYYYINRSDSIVNIKSEDSILDYMDLIETRYDYIEKKYSELKDYNDYYLVNILLTAYDESFLVQNPSETLKQRLESYYNKCVSVIQKNENGILKILDSKKKMKLYTLLYDREIYKKLVENLMR